jgi:hypothetical protein
MYLGYAARFVAGSCGRYGEGHAWLTFERDGQAYLMEVLASPIGLKLPELSIVRYAPRFSVFLDGKNVAYDEHEDRKFRPSLRQVVALTSEWIFFWTAFWLTFAARIPRKLVAKFR